MWFLPYLSALDLNFFTLNNIECVAFCRMFWTRALSHVSTKLFSDEIDNLCR